MELAAFSLQGAIACRCAPRPTGFCLLCISTFHAEGQCSNWLLEMTRTGLLLLFMKWGCARAHTHWDPDTLRGRRQLISEPSSARPPNPALSPSPLFPSQLFSCSFPSVFHNNYVGPGMKFGSESLPCSLSRGLAHTSSTGSRHCRVNHSLIFNLVQWFSWSKLLLDKKHLQAQTGS